MSKLDQAKYEMQDTANHAGDALRSAEDAQRYLDRGEIDRAIAALEQVKARASWACTKAEWTLRRLLDQKAI